MATLPQFQNNDRDFQLMQNSWATALNPIINNPTNQMNVLKNVLLVSGDNTINHKLGRNLQGWIIVGQNASATFYDKQAANQSPHLTLVLNSSANVTINLGVF